MTTQRLSTIVNIGGGLTGAFRRSVDDGAAGIGQMSARIRQASVTARSLQQQIDRGELGAEGMASATRQARQFDDTLGDLQAQYSVLERSLEGGELGREEANRARQSMERLANEMRDTEGSAARLRAEIEGGELGAEAMASATRQARQFDDTMGDLQAQYSVLERSLEGGELGREEANRARQSMERLANEMRDTEGSAARLRAEIEGAGLGKDGIAAANREARRFDATLGDLQAQHGILERRLDRGELGRREANRARQAMERLEREMRDAEDSAARLRAEIERGELGRETVAALRREVERLNGEIDATSSGMTRTGSAGRAGFGRAAAGAAVATGAIAAVGFAINGSVEELQRLRQLQFRAGLIDTQGLQRAGLAFQQLGIDADEGADFFAESVSEIRLRLGELAAEGKQSQLEIARTLGVDLSALADLSDEDLILAQFDHVRRVYQEQGADVARALTESFQGGVEAQRLASISALPQAEYEAFIATLQNGSTTSEETFDSIQQLGVGFGQSGLQVERLKRTIVGGLEPALTGLLDQVNPMIEATSTWLEENRTIAAIIGGVLLGGILALSVAVGVLSVVALLGLVPAGIATVIAWSPVIAIILAIIAVVGLLVAAGILLYKNWDEIVYEVKQGWADIKIAALEGADFILAQIERILDAAGPLVSLGEKIAGAFGFDVDVRGSVSDARGGRAAEIAATQQGQEDRRQVRAEETIARRAEQAGGAGGPLGGLLPALPGAGTVVEGDTTINNEINVTQNESEDPDTTYARVQRISVDQVDALAASGSL